MDGYTFEKYSAASVCPRCCKKENGIFSIHTLCAATLKLYCPISWADGEICFDSLCEIAISARPLVRLRREKFLSQNLLKMLTSPLFEKFNELSVETGLIENICFYLDPFPELVAITYASSLRVRKKSHRPFWTDVNLKPGMSLYMTFQKFEGCAYVTNIDTEPSAMPGKVLRVQDELLVCRDHFAIQDVCGTSDPLHSQRVRGQPVFYHRINLRQIGTKQLNIRSFSDGRFLRALLPLDTSLPIVEWNIQPSSIPKITYWFSNSRLALPAFNRCEYHDLSNISGISAVVQGSTTIGLFCHRREPHTRFRSFVARFERTYPRMNLIYLFFPIHEQEQIQAIAIRRIPDLRFPTNTPVIQIATNKGRTYSFGPQPQDEDLFEILSLFGQNSDFGWASNGLIRFCGLECLKSVRLLRDEELPPPPFCDPRRVIAQLRTSAEFARHLSSFFRAAIIHSDQERSSRVYLNPHPDCLLNDISTSRNHHIASMDDGEGGEDVSEIQNNDTELVKKVQHQITLSKTEKVTLDVKWSEGPNFYSPEPSQCAVLIKKKSAPGAVRVYGDGDRVTNIVTGPNKQTGVVLIILKDGESYRTGSTTGSTSQSSSTATNVSGPSTDAAKPILSKEDKELSDKFFNTGLRSFPPRSGQITHPENRTLLFNPVDF
ncbi:hypothetical protein CLAIMM_14603 [Cladophialophora immunda]|nr:hypothetical protein CLAIMM_14603 [Cladophialophora immunda]